jgi:hypothetical protein
MSSSTLHQLLCKPWEDIELVHRELVTRRFGGEQCQQEIAILQAPVTHACNSSYSRGRDQEDRSLKPAWANSSQDPILKNPNTHTHTKRLVEWLKKERERLPSKK